MVHLDVIPSFVAVVGTNLFCQLVYWKPTNQLKSGRQPDPQKMLVSSVGFYITPITVAFIVCIIYIYPQRRGLPFPNKYYAISHNSFGKNSKGTLLGNIKLPPLLNFTFNSEDEQRY